jgi:hypothetical protein
MTPDDYLQVLAERLARLVRESESLISQAKLNGDGDATVPLGALNRLSREVRGTPQASTRWMSVS